MHCLALAAQEIEKIASMTYNLTPQGLANQQSCKKNDDEESQLGEQMLKVVVNGNVAARCMRKIALSSGWEIV